MKSLSNHNIQWEREEEKPIGDGEKCKAAKTYNAAEQSDPSLSTSSHWILASRNPRIFEETLG